LHTQVVIWYNPSTGIVAGIQMSQDASGRFSIKQSRKYTHILNSHLMIKIIFVVIVECFFVFYAL